MNQQIFYRAVITSHFRTKNLVNFYESIGDEEGQTSLYLTFGMSSKWSDREEDVGFAPPFPNDDLSGVSTVWENIDGILKVDKSLIDPVIPRRDWGDINYANPRTFRIGDIVVTNTATYNQTEDVGGWGVYRVIDVPDAGGCSIEDFTDKQTCLDVGGIWTPSYESDKAPSGMGNAEKMGVYQDGYVWEYLYTIPSDVAINRCTNELIVVPTPNELRDNPQKWGYKSNLTGEHEEYDLIYRAKVVSLRFRAWLDSIYFPESALPQNKGFRQLSLIMNPLLAKEHVYDNNVIARGETYTRDDLLKHSGEMLYIENRPPIYRSLDQVEQLNIIFEV